MNIVWLTAEFPYPPNTGGRIGQYKRIAYMARNHRVFLFSIMDKKEEEAHLPHMESVCASVRWYNRQTHKTPALVRSLRYPYPCASRIFGAIRRDIQDCLARHDIDLIMVEFPQMLMNVLPWAIGVVPIVLHQHNIEYAVLRQLAGSEPGLLKKMIFHLEASRMRRYEKDLYTKYPVDLFTFVSTEDKSLFEKRYGLRNTYLMPVGSEVEGPSQVAVPADNNVAFIGKMTYPPNREGAKWFVRSVWPLIKKDVPDARLFLVGKDPPEDICRLACEDITVTGTVESVDAYYESAKIIIIPLLSGGGVKVKLLEALGKGKLTVSTPKGVEGTDFADREHLLVESDPQAFAAACGALLLRPEQYLAMAARAKEKVAGEYAWGAVVGNLEQKLFALCRERK